jgi:DNA replication and repair protein RecF
MPIDKLALTNFRSYPEYELELVPTINLVVGPNASGKTNLLESIFVASATKSFRAKDPELVRHDQDHFRVVLNVGEDEMAIGYQTGGGQAQKKVTHNGVKQPLSRHIGSLPVVLFEPGDLQIVSGAPEGRRRYLDFILCQTDRSYVAALNQYRRVLRQRNSLLANFSIGQVKEEIFAWDLKLTELAGLIYQRRTELLAYLGELVTDIYGQIAGQSLPIELTYLPSVKGKDYADSFMSALGARLITDLAAGFTTIGPHREDFAIRFRDNNITAVASRGEIRTMVLALRLAELTYNEKTTGKKPVLLLDDVFSELDQARRQDLVRRLDGYQTLITTTEADSVLPDIPGDYKLIKTSSDARAHR